MTGPASIARTYVGTTGPGVLGDPVLSGAHRHMCACLRADSGVVLSACAKSCSLAETLQLARSHSLHTAGTQLSTNLEVHLRVNVV